MNRSLFTTMCLLLLLSESSSSVAQSPRSPSEELSTFQVADQSLRVELVVAEPDVVSPVAIAWDASGAMYVVEMLGYPVTPDSGKIKRLVDRDGDGQYETVTVFADRLNSPTGVMPYRDGILVTAAPDILFLRDGDNDGIAEQREVMWTGFRTGNQQLRVNGLQYGIDNWIYGANGRSGGNVRKPSETELEQVSIEQRDFRFHSRDDRFEAITGMSQFGLAHDSWGNRFISWNHRFARQVMLEAKHITRNPQLIQHAVVDTAATGDDRRVYPLSGEKPIFNQDPGGYFTSLSGLTIYRGDALGSEYKGDAFAGESAQGTIVHRRFDESDAAFVARRTAKDSDFLASSDPWFHPVNFATGPDGALYIVDFYRQLVEHPQWAHAAKRKGVDWQAGAAHGRIWRVVSDRGTSKKKPQHLKTASTSERVEALGHPNGWWRDTAQRLIVQQRDQVAIPLLRSRLIENERLRQSPTESALTRLHCMWTLHGLDALRDNELVSLLSDDDARVRSQAVKLAEERFDDSPTVRQAFLRVITDPDPRCHYQIGLALGSLPEQELLKALREFASKSSDDHHSRLAILSSAGPAAEQLLRSLLTSQDSNESQRDLLYELGRLASRDEKRQPDDEWLLKLEVDPSESDSHFAAFAGVCSGLSTDGVTLRTLESDTESGELKTRIADIFRVASEYLSSSDAESDLKRMSIRILSLGHAESVRRPLLVAVRSSSSLELKRWALEAIGDLNDAETSRQLMDQIGKLDSGTRGELILTSLRSTSGATALLEAINNEVLFANEVPEDVRLGLFRHPDDDLQRLAKKLLSANVSTDRQRVIDQYMPALATAGSATRGGLVFKENCLQCHAVKGVGGGVGPDLSRIGTRSAETLLVSILDPSREVSYELKTYVILTTSGKIVSGMIVSDTPEVVTVCTADGHKENILREDIEERQSTGKSIMPEGLERAVNPQSMADLIQFLKTPNSESLK